MEDEASVRIDRIEHDVVRPGYDDAFHRLTFAITATGDTSFDVPIWIHGAYPASEVGQVAALFLATTLREAADAADASASSFADAGALGDAPSRVRKAARVRAHR